MSFPELHHRQFWRPAPEIEEKPFENNGLTASPVLVTDPICHHQPQMVTSAKGQSAW
jgi:hypothetical protein